MDKKRRTKKLTIPLVIEAFQLRDRIVRGELSGGTEPPRDILSASEKDDGSIAVSWKNPTTGGLSDCTYHSADTSVCEDIYRLTKDNRLTVNGMPESFGMDCGLDFIVRENVDTVKSFCRKWDLKEPVLHKEEK